MGPSYRFVDSNLKKYEALVTNAALDVTKRLCYVADEA